MFEERFGTRLPAEVKDASNHVLIFHYGPFAATLIEELEAAGVKTIIVEEDEVKARKLIDAKKQIVFGRLDEGLLSRTCLDKARAYCEQQR